MHGHERVLRNNDATDATYEDPLLGGHRVKKRYYDNLGDTSLTLYPADSRRTSW